MGFKDLDQFSSFFQFNFDKSQRKGSVTGAFLTVIVFSIVFGYLIYLLLLFFNNQIDPKYASQSFIQDQVSINLQENLVGFRYEYDTNQSLDDLQQQQNLTYLVFQTYFLLQNGTNNQLIELNYTKCSDPKLYGFNCFDFSQIQDQQLLLSTQANIFSSLYIFVYRCSDTDQFKQTVPNNCANQTQIDQVINNPYANLRFNFYTSQFNMTSKEQQVNYRSQVAFLQGNQFQLYLYNIQKQITKVKQGILFQREDTFSSPIQYNLDHQTFAQSFSEQTGQKQILQVTFELDEIVQYIRIQYPTLPEILALCNSTLTLLMCLSYIGKIISKQLIKRDIFMLILSNIYRDTFENILQANNLIQKIEEPLLTERENYEHEDDEKVQNNNFSQVPNLETKSKLSIDERQNQYSYQLENKYKSINFDFINENSIDQLNEKNVSRLSMDNKYQQKHKLSFNIPQQSQKNKQKNTNNSYLTPNITSQQLNMLQINSQSQKNLTKEQKCLDVNASSHFYHKKTLDFTNKSPNQVQKTKQQQEMKNKFQKQIQILNQLQNNPLQKKLQQILFKSRICKKEIYLISKGLEPQTKQQIEDQVDKSLDIMHLYQDIIFLKKAVMILLNHEQLAAIQLVGFSSKLKDQTSNLNHFEEQFSIFESQEKQKKHIEIFLNRIISKVSQDIIDQRIVSSIT